MTRTNASGTVTLYVDPATGDDGNDGSSGAPLETPQEGVNRLQNDYDFRGHVAELQLCDGTYIDQQVIAFGAPVGTPQILITGNRANPGNVIWRLTGSGQTALKIRDFSIVTLGGIQFESTGSGNVFLNPSQGGILDHADLRFGNNPSGYDVMINNGGKVNVTPGLYDVWGARINHLYMAGPSALDIVLAGGSIGVPSALSFTDFYRMDGPCMVQYTATVSFTGPGAAGATGRKYNRSNNPTLSLNGTVLPGNVAGI